MQSETHIKRADFGYFVEMKNFWKVGLMCMRKKILKPNKASEQRFYCCSSSWLSL